MRTGPVTSAPPCFQGPCPPPQAARGAPRPAAPVLARSSAFVLIISLKACFVECPQASLDACGHTPRSQGPPRPPVFSYTSGPRLSFLICPLLLAECL